MVTHFVLVHGVAKLALNRRYLAEHAVMHKLEHFQRSRNKARPHCFHQENSVSFGAGKHFARLLAIDSQRLFAKHMLAVIHHKARARHMPRMRHGDICRVNQIGLRHRFVAAEAQRNTELIAESVGICLSSRCNSGKLRALNIFYCICKSVSNNARADNTKSELFQR